MDEFISTEGQFQTLMLPHLKWLADLMLIPPDYEPHIPELFLFLVFQARMEVEDLFTDLADGKKLLKLLEIISGEKLGKPNNGKMRVHKVENVNKSLAFLQTKKVRNIFGRFVTITSPKWFLKFFFHF